MQEGDRRINREKRQHIKCLNPKELSAAASCHSPPFFKSRLLISPSLSLSYNGRGRSLLLVLYEEETPAAVLTGGAASLGNTSITVALFLLHCCFFYDNQSF